MCQGTVLLQECFTLEGFVEPVDCATNNSATTQQTCDVDAQAGARCVYATGSTCEYSDPVFGSVTVGPCQGPEGGCVVIPTGTQCRTHVNNYCVPTFPTDFSCAGDLLVGSCPGDGPNPIDCAAFGGTCQVNLGNAQCVVNAGSLCGDLSIGAVACAAGLQCLPGNGAQVCQ